MLAALLAVAALAGATGCGRAAPSFSASFATPQGATVALDFWGERDFRIASSRGGVETWVIDGRIHLVIAPSLAFAGRGRTLLVGELGARPSAPPGPPPEAWSWGAATAADVGGLAVRSVAIGPGAPPGAAGALAVAAEPRLAAAQFAIDQTLRPAMDMALCGDAVNALVAAWPAALTGRGWAAIAAPSGVRLQGALAPAPARPRLPEGHDFEDLRVASRQGASERIVAPAPNDVRRAGTAARRDLAGAGTRPAAR